MAMEIICAFTRKQALINKQQFDVSNYTKKYNFRYPVFITENAANCINGINENSMDLIFTELKKILETTQEASDHVIFAVNSAELIAEIGVLDIDDDSTVVTIMTHCDS